MFKRAPLILFKTAPMVTLNNLCYYSYVKHLKGCDILGYLFKKYSNTYLAILTTIFQCLFSVAENKHDFP